MIPSLRTAGLVALAIGAIVCCALLCPIEATGCLAFALGTGFLLGDKLLRNTRALPAAASSTVDGAALLVDNTTRGEFVAPCQVKISAPAVNATMAPDTRTFTYSVITSDAANLGTPTVIASAVITQTGAGGAGAAAATATIRLPLNVKKYIGLRIVSGASTGDASSVAGTLELLF